MGGEANFYSRPFRFPKARKHLHVPVVARGRLSVQAFLLRLTTKCVRSQQVLVLIILLDSGIMAAASQTGQTGSWETAVNTYCAEYISGLRIELISPHLSWPLSVSVGRRLQWLLGFLHACFCPWANNDTNRILSCRADVVVPFGVFPASILPNVLLVEI